MSLLFSKFLISLVNNVVCIDVVILLVWIDIVGRQLNILFYNILHRDSKSMGQLSKHSRAKKYFLGQNTGEKAKTVMSRPGPKSSK